MKIRAHHLLCMQGFQGYGYSKNFVENLRTIIATLTAAPDTEVEIISSCDDICAHCPHNKNNECIIKPEANELVKRQDLDLLAILNLQPGTKIKIRDALALIEKKLYNPMIIKKLCGNCEWKEKCLWFRAHVDLK